jgi:diaminobutyrate-2-oxoglutarate transaminase
MHQPVPLLAADAGSVGDGQPTQGELLARQEQRESSARSYPRRLPVALVEGRGTQVRDADGRLYLDCLTGAGALAVGHHHPYVDQAIERALRSGVPTTTLDFATPWRDAFVESLFAILPPGLRDGRIHFCGPTGADAVEAALKLTKVASGRAGTVAFGGGYHGMTHGALAATGDRGPKEQLAALMPSVQFLPFPSERRPTLGADLDTDAAMCARLLEWTLADDHSGVPLPASVLVEPVQGEGGVNPAPPAFAREVRASTRRHRVPLVVDEVQTGLGRTGSLWASEALGFDPDVLVLSKAIGGGLPLAVIVYRPELDGWAPGAHTGTFRGNQLALAAGAATIDLVVRDGLADRARELGRRLQDGLQDAVASTGTTAWVRGAGLMLGVELVDEHAVDTLGHPRADGRRAARVQQELLARGVIAERGGRGGAVVRFLPPLTISAVEVDAVCGAFADALAATGSRS